MEQTFYTYLHCRPNGDPFYVGKGRGKRCFNFSRRNPHHKNIVAKYGAENIGVFVFECASERQAFDDEIHQIKQLRAEGFVLANITDGGDGVSGLSKKISDKQKALLSKKMMGNKNALGYRHTPESLMKLSEAQRNRADYQCIAEKLRLINQKKILCIDTGETFESASVAASLYGLKHKSCVSKCCRGVRKSAGGHAFRYI